MRTALEIYFGIMLFWTGYHTHDDTDWKDYKNYIKILFCPVIAILVFVLSLIDRSWYWISTTFQIQFFWKHYVLRRNYTKEVIDSWNMTLEAKSKNNIPHKVWRTCVRLANERFNKQSKL
jgi:hypothetical protein